MRPAGLVPCRERPPRARAHPRLPRGACRLSGHPSRLDESERFLLRRHPRATWERHRNLDEVARFWLQRHALFRGLDRTIRDGIQDALDGDDETARFRPWLHRHLGLFLWQLEEHHGVEDHHYFPLFRKAEPKLARGFEVIERDHDALHATLERLAMRANDVLQSGPRGAGAIRSALGRLHAAQVALSPELGRHLDDEEDLVVPLILERGETALFSTG